MPRSRALRVRRSCLRVALAGLAALALSGTAHAQPAGAGGLEASLAVLELYIDGQDYEKTGEYVERVTESLLELEKFALLARADAERQILSKMTTSSRRITDEKLAQIEELMKEGDKLVYTNPQKAIEILARAKTELKSIMETLSLNEKIRQDFFRTQMLLARSHYDNGNREKAGEIMEEIIRVFGDEEKVTEEEYHPDIVALYRETYRKLSAQRRGVLTVRTEPPGAEVLINGKLQAQKTPATYEGLYPGTVTVAARTEKRESMIHKVKIELGRPSEISIDIDYETSLAFDGTRFGFVFADAATLESRVADFASRIGSMLNVDKVLVTGLVGRDGRTYLEGYLVDVEAQQVTVQQSLYTKSNVVSNKRTFELARLVAGVDTEAPEPVYKPWYTNWVGWTGVGLGVAGGVLGAIFYTDYQSKLDEVQCNTGPPDCKTRSERLVIAGDAESARNIAGAGFGIAAAGIIGGTLAFVLMKEEDLEASTGSAAPHLEYIAPALIRGGAGLGASVRF